MATTHHLKCAAPYFDAIERGDKTFEIRKNDRAFQAGDTLILERVDEADAMVVPWGQNRQLGVRVTFVLPGGQFGLEPGHCVMAIRFDQPMPTSDRGIGSILGGEHV